MAINDVQLASTPKPEAEYSRNINELAVPDFLFDCTPYCNTGPIFHRLTPKTTSSHDAFLQSVSEQAVHGVKLLD